MELARVEGRAAIKARENLTLSLSAMTESSGVSASLLTAGGAREYLVDFDISPDEVSAAVAQRTGSDPITPDLVGPD